MFAPPVARAQTNKAACSTTKKSPSRLLLTSRPFDGGMEQEADPAGLTAQAPRPGLSWNFSKIPLLPPDSASRRHTPPPVEAHRPIAVQPRLVVGRIDDPTEREADIVADQVMRMPDAALSVSSGPPLISRKCAACEDEERRQLQTKTPAATIAASGEAPSIIHEALSVPGQPLDAKTRDFFEQRFGQDFGRVRVHTDGIAADSAARIGAHAYTVGSDIVFGAARFDPATSAGRKLLAHELTHVVQQGGQRKALSRDGVVAADTPAPGVATPSDAVRALAARFENYAMKGEAALPRAAIDPRDADRIRSNIANLRNAITGMRKVADNGDDNVSVTLLSALTSSRLRQAGARLKAAAPGATSVAETAPVSIAASSPNAAAANTVEREAQRIANIIGSVAPASTPLSGTLVRRQAAPEIVQEIEQETPVIDQLIKVSIPGIAGVAAANDTVAVGVLAGLLGSPVVVVAAVVVVALLAVAAVWYFWDQNSGDETRKVMDVPPGPAPAPAPAVTPPSPAPPPEASGPRRSSRVPVMPPGLSPEQQTLWKECKAMHDTYKVFQENAGSLSPTIARILDSLENSRPVTDQEKIDLCNLLDEQIRENERQHQGRKKYIEAGCDQFDWFNEGATEAERVRRHESELESLDNQLKSLREALTKWCPPFKSKQPPKR